jgi:hypothetical protein
MCAVANRDEHDVESFSMCQIGNLTKVSVAKDQGQRLLYIMASSPLGLVTQRLHQRTRRADICIVADRVWL